MNDLDEPDRSPTPPLEADDQPPPSNHSGSSLSSIEIELADASGDLSKTELQTLHDLSRRVLDQITNQGSVRVRIVNDDEMIRAHQKYSGLSSTTDVLTFDLAAGEKDIESKQLDTDLIICIDEAQRQAAHRTHTRVHELLLYIVHGILHCLGHDDHNDKDFARMHQREDELFTNAGIGAIFQDEQRNQLETPS